MLAHARTRFPLAAAAAAGVLASLAVPGVASAAPPWSDPQVVAPFAVREPQLAFNTSGGLGIASLEFGAAATRLLSLRAGEVAPVASRDVGSIEEGPLPYARTWTLSLRRRPTNDTRTLIGYSFGRSAGTVGTLRTLKTVQLRPGEAEIAVSPDGHAIITFAEERRGSTRVWLSTRRAGGSRFTTPRVVRGTGSARSLGVSVNDRGRWVLAYSYGSGRVRSVEARIGTTAGRTGGLQRLGGQLGISRLDALVAATGRTTVAWATHDGGEEQNEPTQLRTNVAPAGRTAFAGQVVLDRAAPGALATEPAPPSLAAAPDGTTVVGYTLSGRYAGTGTAGSADTVTPARVSVQDSSARFGAPQELAEDGVVGQVAARADGTFAVPYATGVTLEPTTARLYVALRGPRAAAFAPGELVTDDAGEESATAFEPGAFGAPLVLHTRGLQRGAAISRRSASAPGIPGAPGSGGSQATT